MSKPKHFKRGRGYYVGYGLMSTDMSAHKGDLDYRAYLKDEISYLSTPSAHRSKLIKYLKRVS